MPELGSSPVGSVYAIHRDHFETHDRDPKPSYGVPRIFVIVGDAGQRREARNLSARIDGVGRSGVTVVNKNAADHRQGSGIKQRKACQRLASNKRSSITAQVSANSSDRLQIQHGFARLRAPIVWA